MSNYWSISILICTIENWGAVNPTIWLALILAVNLSESDVRGNLFFCGAQLYMLLRASNLSSGSPRVGVSRVRGCHLAVHPTASAALA